MRSVQLVAQRKLEVAEMALPRDPGPGEVLVKLKAVGICGSDMHWYLDGRMGVFAAGFPQVLGHEPAGEIVAVGPGVADLQPGDRVALEPTLSCGRCEFCLLGQHMNCVKARFMGSPQAPGLLLEYATVPAKNAERFPDLLTYAQATLIEPLAVMIHLLDLVAIRPGDTVGVLGTGPIGMLVCAIARAAGASQVLAADKLPHRLDLARKMGATTAVEMKSFGPAVRDLTHGRGVDVAVDAAGFAETVNAGLAIARLGGTFVLIAIPADNPLPVDWHTAMAKGLRIQVLKRSNHRGEAAARLLSTGAIGDALITHQVALEAAPSAFEMLAGYRDGVGKIVVDFTK